MRIDNLMQLAQRAGADREPGLLPVIEKEIVHYQVLHAMSEERLLVALSFQGGTCLRLCYGSPRYSEDLDFAAGSQFFEIDFERFSRRLTERLEDVFGDAVRVRQPKKGGSFDHVALSRWTVVVRTAPQRDDLPSQRVKVEVASATPYTHVLRSVSHNYDVLPSNMSSWLIGCQSEREILADKLVSFANTEGRLRRRDLWDIPFLLDRVSVDDEVVELVQRKLSDYGCRFPVESLLDRAVDRIDLAMEDGSFALEMKRFLPKAAYDSQLSDGGWHLAERTARAYERVMGHVACPGDMGNASLGKTFESLGSGLPERGREPAVPRHHSRYRERQ